MLDKLKSIAIINFKNMCYYWLDYILKKYFYTMNHKSLGLNYFYFSLISGLSGAALATMMRIEMSFPGSPFLSGDSLSYLQVMTGHALIMIFFVVVPLFFGGFANFLIPYHIGSKDVAFPSLNSLGFWMQPCGFILMSKVGFLSQQYWNYYDYLSFFEKYKNNNNNMMSFKKELKNIMEMKNDKYYFMNNILNNFYDYYQIYLLSDSVWFLIKEFMKKKNKKKYISKCSSVTMTVTGWTFITPFSSNLSFSGFGVQDILMIGVMYAGLSSTISMVNLLVTRSVLSMFGIKNSKVLIPFFSISLFLMLSTLALINPVLGAAMIMLILDSHWHTAFFDFTYGGDAMLFQHLFWFFGHPEVYVLMVPAFGIINEMLPSLSYSRLAAKHHMMWAIYVMTYMGFLVWGHHMYLMGLDHSSSSLYSTITILMSLPATIKVVNWILTLMNTNILDSVTLVFSMMFVLFFLVAGMTGMWLSHVSLNMSMHDTFYVVAHFHIMLSGASIASMFAGIYYYFNILFGVSYNKILALAHAIYYFLGQWITFLPLFWMGFSGLPSSVHDYPSMFMGWHNVATVGHIISLIGIFFFYMTLVEANFTKKNYMNTLYYMPSLNKSLIFFIKKMIKYSTMSYFSFKLKNNNMNNNSN